MTSVTGALERRVDSHLGEQLLVAGGQGLTGLGNLAFTVVMARVLPPGGFATLAAFLSLYLMIHVPAASLSAGSALRPDLARHGRRRALWVGAAIGAGLVAASGPISAVTDLPLALTITAGAVPPIAGLLALERGRLYGGRRHVRVVASLLAEPGVRLTIGVASAALVGAIGASVAVVVAGYAALAVVATGDRTSRATSRPTGATRGAGWTVLAFLLLAALQNQDVLLANGLLAPDVAARFAVLSTLGGIALFAVWQVPLVLMPRAASGERGALAPAVGLATGVGAVVVAVVFAAAAPLIELAFGSRYVDVAGLAGPYTLAMALLGVCRVFVADRLAGGRLASTLVVVGAAAIAQVLLIVTLGDDVSGVVSATLAAVVGLTVVLAGIVALHPTPVAPVARIRDRAARLWARRDVRLVTGLTVAALLLRLLVVRGLWLDEAITWFQASQPFADMITNLRYADVHPPLYHAVIWGTVRLIGGSELALRLPSILAGTAVVPLLYWAGRDLYSRRAGLVSAALGTVAPLAVWYSQEARMYAFLMLFALIAVWMQVRALRRGRATDWVLFALASAALIWTQYFAALQVAVQQIAFAVVVWRRWRADRPVARLVAGWMLTAAVIALSLIPLEPILRDQLIAYGNRSNALVPGAGGASGEGAGAAAGFGEATSVYRLLVNALWGVFGYHSAEVMTAIAALWPVGMLLALALLGRGPWTAGTQLTLAVAVVPFLALFGLGSVKANLFEVRYVLGGLPLVLLLVGRFVATSTRSDRVVAVVTTAAVAVLAFAHVDQVTNRQNPRIYGFRSALTDVSQQAGEDDVLVYAPSYLEPIVAYYAGDVRAEPMRPGSIPDADGDVFVFGVDAFLEGAGEQHLQDTFDDLGRAGYRPETLFGEVNARVWRYGR